MFTFIEWSIKGRKKKVCIFSIYLYTFTTLSVWLVTLSAVLRRGLQYRKMVLAKKLSGLDIVL